MDTIAAIATPPGSGGIGIVRISGERAVPIGLMLFRRAGDRSFTNPPLSHRLYHGHIVSPDGEWVIDEVLFTVMKAPHSYTREDVVEIQAHAGHAALHAILECVTASGARLADPGEFTRRAFLNGRIDLTQAEAVVDLINAKSDRALAAAVGQLRGAMAERLNAVRSNLRDLMGRIEAAIDFTEDGVVEIDVEHLRQRLEEEIVSPMTALCQGFDNARYLRDGIRLAVVGRPNVGKSSLMNAMLGDERAIVTPIPGTTRDVIEAPFAIDGIPIVFLDTAGLHQPNDPIEVIGIERTRQAIDSADLTLLVLDGSQPLSSEDESAYGLTKNNERIIVFNKWDLIRGGEAPPLRLPAEWQAAKSVNTSALCGDGIAQLREAIKEIVVGSFQESATALPNFRQQKTLQSALEAAKGALRALKDGAPMELIAIDLQETHRALGEVIGDAASPDLLDQIFAQFCIGK